MPVPKKELKLYKIEVLESGNSGPSTYYATGEDAFDAYSDAVVHEDAEGHHTHRESLDFDVEVTEVDVTTERFLAWSVK